VVVIKLILLKIILEILKKITIIIFKLSIQEKIAIPEKD
jgi:hypothetical protein